MQKHIIVYYDKQDPANRGWAYRCYSGDHEDSGPLPARRANTSDRTLKAQARRACGVPGTVTPVKIER